LAPVVTAAFFFSYNQLEVGTADDNTERNNIPIQNYALLTNIGTYEMHDP
jgi:hypothetical protein